jgi:hypothetical protein
MSALPRRTVRFLIVVVGLVLGWQVYLFVSAERRLDAALRPQLDRGGPVSVAVTLGFAPEDFHIRVFQSHGVVSGVSGTTVMLTRVPAADVRRIARYYWVQRISPPKEPRS